MGIIRLTALILNNHYPDNILINSAKSKNGKYASFCYLMREGYKVSKEIDRLMISSEAIYDSGEKAEEELHNTVKEIIQFIKSTIN